ncbi:MAG: type II toxin-antitoxin system HicA family toxin [Chitinophagaceae bacterium]|jgi:predicted RNA binding protein YcfA (HicA-like mRNA interferase family)|nr:MAG: type II toxin-antitoxin system HicA family toxin [Chitinophagaceae bacterium]
MNYKQLVKELEKYGWEFEREGKGSHMIFSNPHSKNIISVPFHGNRDLPTGLAKKILKQAKQK